MSQSTGTVAAAATAAPTGGFPVEADERTRDRVLTAILEHGPISAAQLGKLLGLTPAAVRRHLDTLSRHGVIEVKLVGMAGAGAGRPARRYVVSRRGQAEIGDDYLEIARQALTELARGGDQSAVEHFARRRFAAMEAKYRPHVEAAGTDVTARSKALAGLLSADGFVASSNTVNPASALSAEQLCQGHCPIRELAGTFPEFCDAETDVFARLLGVDVRRLSTMASGGHVCTTHVPTGRPVIRPHAAKAAVPSPTVTNPLQERP
ncbi:helix-turn-helix transcriptional regulator [Specibacter cremeus]|uniref:helix-turn-helix transcriptional regulator n=1 Tax=Specibacter cremeus TaxID=1629051 RepID=UPI000F778511|nr:helix-turn-helix domain-containing protein [Specibacter cremeus]